MYKIKVYLLIYLLSSAFVYLRNCSTKNKCMLKMCSATKHSRYTVAAKIIRTLVFSSAKNGFKSVISIFCCSVPVANISLHSQTFIWPFIVIIQSDLCLTTASAPHRDHHHPVCLEWQNKLTQTPEELFQHQDASRNLHAKLPEKLCTIGQTLL